MSLFKRKPQIPEDVLKDFERVEYIFNNNTNEKGERLTPQEALWAMYREKTNVKIKEAGIPKDTLVYSSIPDKKPSRLSNLFKRKKEVK